MGATGHYESHPLTEGTDSGSVSLETPTDTYTVTIDRDSRRSYSRTGTPYLTSESDQQAARLFAFLGENNPIRTAVRNGDNLTEYLQEPLDIAAINHQIKNLRSDRRQLRTKIENAETAAERLPNLQATVAQLETDLVELRKEKDKLEETSQAKTKAGDLSDELSERQTELKTITREIDRLKSTLTNKKSEVETKQEELNSVSISEVPDLSDIETKKDRIGSLGAQISLFEELYRANKNLLRSAHLDTLTRVERTLAEDEVDCWVCGETVPVDQMESHIERIDDRITELQDEKQELEETIEEVETRKQEAQEQRRRRDRLENRIGTLRQQIDEHTADLQGAQQRKEELQSEISDLESELEDVETEYNEELTDLKTNIRDLEQQLEAKQDELESVETQKGDLDDLRQQESDLKDQIESLQRQKTETQQQLCVEFEQTITDIIERFDPGFEYARLETITNEQTGDIEEFELYIAREGRETTVSALSEGEIELIGVAVALAAHRVYNIADTVPCILIDGISQLASEHLRSLISYLEDTADILVTAAYPEAGEFDGEVISPDSWHLVSEEQTAEQ